MGIIKLDRQERVCLQIIPDGPVCNECAYEIAQLVAGLYRSPIQRFLLSRKGIGFERKNVITWEAVFTCTSVSYFLTCPRRLAEIFKIRAETSWKNVFVKYVPLPPALDNSKTAGIELVYRRKDIFSINIEENCQVGPELAAALKGLSGEDKVVIQALFEPINQDKWQRSAEEMYWQFIRGAMSKASQLDRQGVAVKIRKLSNNAARLVLGLLGRNKPIRMQENLNRIDWITRLLQLRKPVDPAKPASVVIRVFLRVAAESRKQARAAGLAHCFADAYKRLSADNELGKCEIKRFAKGFVKDVNLRQLPVIKVNGNIMSVKECGKLMTILSK